MLLIKELLNLTVILISLMLIFTESMSIRLVTFDVDKFRLDSKLISKITDTADCEKFLELMPKRGDKINHIGTEFGDVILGTNRIVRPCNVNSRRIMVCLSGPQIDQAYIKTIRILDNSDSEEKVYIYTRRDTHHTTHASECQSHLRK